MLCFQKSQGNGPLNRVLMAAKRKYMDTELPPQESEGKVLNTSETMAHYLWPMNADKYSYLLVYIFLK